MYFVSFFYLLYLHLARRNENRGTLPLNTGEAHPQDQSANLTGHLKMAKLEDLPLFDFGIIETATNNFNFANKLGQGGFGSVYKVH